MRQYFTYMDIKNPLGKGTIPTEYHIISSVKGITFDYNFCVSEGTNIGDPRKLGYIELAPDVNGDVEVSHYPTGKKPVIDVMNMIFNLFYIPVSLETVNEALDKVERWENRSDVTISGDSLVFPTIHSDF